MSADDLDRFVRESLPRADISWTREERLADTVLGLLSHARRDLGLDLRARLMHLAVVTASTVGLISTMLMSLEKELSLDTLFDAAASLLAAF